MLVAWLFAAFHLIALAIGFGAVRARAGALRGPLDTVGLRTAFLADTLWGVAAVLWIATGLGRLIMGTDKATGYYLSNPVFWGKMLLFAIVFALEIPPMVALMRWRRRAGRGEGVDTASARTYAVISDVQSLLLLLIVLAATAMARGIGGR